MARQCLVWYLVLAIFALAVAPRVDGSFLPSAYVSGDRSDRQKDIDAIRTVLEKKAVSSRLHDLGFTTEEINERVGQLSDREIHHIALRLDHLKTGGTAEGVVIGLIIILLVIVVILPLFGVRIWR